MIQERPLLAGYVLLVAFSASTSDYRRYTSSYSIDFRSPVVMTHHRTNLAMDSSTGDFQAYLR